MATPTGTGNEVDDEHLLRFVRGRDVPCPGCGYNVRDLTGDRCPECGQGLELRLHLAEPRQAALIAGLVGLAAGAGFGGLLLIYLVAMVVTEPYAGPAVYRVFRVIVPGFVAHAVLLGLWVRHWNRVRRAPAATRRVLVMVCWVLPLAFLAAFKHAV